MTALSIAALPMTTLDDWNRLPEAAALPFILACCGSRAFADALLRGRPFADVDTLLSAADAVWRSLGASDWLEAFACHPRIGEASVDASRQSSAWSKQEQLRASAAADSVLLAIAEKNREYEARHGFIYIVCAEGKSAEDLVALLNRRLGNTTEAEIAEAAEQQRQITRLRLRKWLSK